MKNSISALLRGSIGALALIATSCAQGDESSSYDEVATATEATPHPVATIDLKDGHAIEFYDFGNEVLISEIGKAGTDHVLNEGNTPSALVKNGVAREEVLSRVWSSISHDGAVPRSLLDIQARWKAAPPPESTRNSGEVVHRVPAAVISGPAAASPVTNVWRMPPPACGNGCCDTNWMSGFGACMPQLWDAGFYTHWNGGYSWLDFEYVDHFSGFACAGIGTSSYHVHVSDGSDYTWPVPEGTYRTYDWDSGFWGINRGVYSSANSWSDPHLHSFCGGAY